MARSRAGLVHMVAGSDLVGVGGILWKKEYHCCNKEKQPAVGVLKLNTDGSSKRKRGAAGIGGVLRNSYSNVEGIFWGQLVLPVPKYSGLSDKMHY